jgi:hypothetical protein
MANEGPEGIFEHENINLGGRHGHRIHYSNSSGTGKPSRQGRFLGWHSALLKRGQLCEAGVGETRLRRRS